MTNWVSNKARAISLPDWKKYFRRTGPHVRPITVVGALILISVPTVFTILPEMALWNWVIRGLIAAGWVALALVTVVSSTRRDLRFDKLETEKVKTREQLRQLATFEILSALLPPTGVPSSYNWTVYIYDKDTKQLRPGFPTTPDDAIMTFEPGYGATGYAYLHRELILVTDDEVSDATYGLSPAQQAHFAGSRAVVASPIFSEGDLLGVLTAISGVNDGYFDNEAGRGAIRQQADIIGVVLAAILGLSSGKV